MQVTSYIVASRVPTSIITVMQPVREICGVRVNLNSHKNVDGWTDVQGYYSSTGFPLSKKSPNK